MIFLHLRRIKIPKQTQTSEDNNCHPKKITKLAIGIEGGYNPEEESSLFDIEDQRSIVVLPSFKTIPVDSDDLPQQVKNSIYGILSAVSASRADEAQALAGTWDGEKRQVSRHAPNLVQLDNGKSIPPSGWKCEKCDKTDNLWLNLTDGSILCGRKFFDGTGGNNHAVEHYNEFKYPLAVKLGTITPDGADVYSYDEDDMVEDPLLDKHLSHFGINVAQMKKTEKSMLELELDYNQRIGEWSLLTESDAILKPLYGSGFTGLANLGNSCYLNSVVQVLFSIPEFQSFYYPGDKFTRCPPSDPSLDFNCQMAKLAHGILSGKYSKAPEGTTLQEQEGIKPNMFKNLIGRGHPEFSTKRQQDAQEFFLHLINMIDRNSRIQGCDSPTKALCFEVEDRVECMASKKVRYTCRTEYILALPVPLEKMINRKEVTEYEAKKAAGETLDPKDVIRPKVHLDACFESLVQPEVISDFYSTAIAGKTTASKSSRLKTFPNYLMLQIKKFELGQDWLPKKLDIAVDVPDILDLAKLRGHGLEPGEEILPEGPTSGADSDASSASVVVFDSQAQAQINSLMDMGFSMDACKRAVHATANSGLEAALTWLCEHSTDPDFNDPFTLDQASGATGSSFIPNPEALESLKSMGLPEEAAIRGLKETVSFRAFRTSFSSLNTFFLHVTRATTLREQLNGSSVTPKLWNLHLSKYQLPQLQLQTNKDLDVETGARSIV